VGDANRLESDGEHTYTYDAEGNMVTKTTIIDGTEITYVWDYRNRLVEVHYDSPSAFDSITYFTYDVFNRRVSQSGGGTSSIEAFSPQLYFYDGGQINGPGLNSRMPGHKRPATVSISIGRALQSTRAADFLAPICVPLRNLRIT
jgi:YD repeat-containing protein